MAKIPLVEKLLIDGPSGPLEAQLEIPQEQAATGIAVVCHPHPVYGGTMQNKVVHTLSRAFVSQGMAALRFNFRGVGESAGSYGDGDGELEDALAAINWAQTRFANLPLWLAGFSFGGAIAIRASLQVTAAGLVSIAPAVSRFAAHLDGQPECPWLIVQGDEDELVDIEETVSFVDGLAPGPELVVLTGGEHFFHGRLVELRDTLEGFVRRHTQ